MPPQNFQSKSKKKNLEPILTWRLPMLPTTSMRAPADNWLPCANLISSVWANLASLRAGLPAQPDFHACCSYLPQPDFPLRTMATCHGPTSDYMPTWALLPIPDNDGCVRQTWRLRPKRVCPRTRVTLMAASTARGLSKTMSANDKTRSAGYQPSALCAEHRQFLRILNSPAGP